MWMSCYNPLAYSWAEMRLVDRFCLKLQSSNSSSIGLKFSCANFNFSFIFRSFKSSLPFLANALLLLLTRSLFFLEWCLHIGKRLFVVYEVGIIYEGKMSYVSIKRDWTPWSRGQYTNYLNKSVIVNDNRTYDKLNLPVLTVDSFCKLTRLIIRREFLNNLAHVFGISQSIKFGLNL